VASLHQGAGHPQSSSPPGLGPAEPRLRARLDHRRVALLAAGA